MPAFNQVIMVGHLTCDPKLTYTPNQTAVADFSLAVNRNWKGADGQAKEDVCFLDIRAFGNLADILHKYMRKGSCVLVQGYLVFEKWQAKDGTNHSKHRLVAQSVQFLTAKGSCVEAGSEAGANEQTVDSDVPF